MFIGTFFLTMTDIITSQNTDLFRTVYPYIVTDCLWLKPTDALQFPNCLLVATTALQVSGSFSAHHQELISRTTALVQFMQFGGRLLSGSVQLPLINNWKIIVYLLVSFISNTDLFSGITLYFSSQKRPDQFWHLLCCVEAALSPQ